MPKTFKAKIPTKKKADMKIKIKKNVKEAAKKKKVKQEPVIHGRATGNSYPLKILCGEDVARIDLSTTIPDRITCPNCLVKMDEGLENGSLLINNGNQLTLAENYIEELYVVYTEAPEMINEPDEEPGPWDWKGDKDLHTAFDHVSLSQPASPFYELEYANFPVAVGDKVFVAWVNFTDGGTFGSTRGQFAVEGIFKTREEAVSALEDVGSKYEGYFSRLENVFVDEAIVK